MAKKLEHNKTQSRRGIMKFQIRPEEKYKMECTYKYQISSYRKRMDTENDILVNCSDDELNNAEGTWEPTPEEILNLYETLDSKGVLDFEWQCPGRRSPSVNSIKSDLIDKGNLSDDDGTKMSEPNEFDFDDEFGLEHPSPKISPRRRSNQTNSAQKRVARLDKVMFDIQRHRKLDELELQLNISDGSPNTKLNAEGKS